MVYELKKVSNFSNKHIFQTVDAKQQRNADYALLITNAKRSKNDFGFSIVKRIIIVHPAGALTLISILREHLLAVSKLQLSNEQREETTKAVLEYIQSPSFKNGIESIITNTVELYESLRKEVKEHVHIWQDRMKRYNDINNKALYIENKVNNSSCYHDLKVHEVSATVAVTTPKRSGEPHGQPDCSHILSV